jgi:hypothetical protein
MEQGVKQNIKENKTYYITMTVESRKLSGG